MTSSVPTPGKAASMDHATCSRQLLATHFATSLFPLTVRLVPLITQIGHTLVQFRRADLTPRASYQFEVRLQEQLRELGRIIAEWIFNHLEPHDRTDLPGQIESHGTWYRRRSKTPNRSVATLFGMITLWRTLYLDVHRDEAQAARLLSWLEQADRSSGSRRPVLAVGRDGLMVPIRGQACYREGATATVSVYDRKGRRLGTVYLGRMPEPGQGALSGQLTTLIEAVLRGWTGAPPRLAYITDGGNHQTRYYRRVLQRMSDPHHPGRRLRWQWVIDYYHASGYITQLAEALFSDAREGARWARKMGRWLKEKPRGIYRVLHSAAAIRRRRIIMSAAKREQYHSAYAYLRKRIRWLDSVGSRRDHLPIGSG